MQPMGTSTVSPEEDLSDISHKMLSWDSERVKVVSCSADETRKLYGKVFEARLLALLNLQLGETQLLSHFRQGGVVESFSSVSDAAEWFGSGVGPSLTTLADVVTRNAIRNVADFKAGLFKGLKGGAAAKTAADEVQKFAAEADDAGLVVHRLLLFHPEATRCAPEISTALKNATARAKADYLPDFLKLASAPPQAAIHGAAASSRAAAIELQAANADAKAAEKAAVAHAKAAAKAAAAAVSTIRSAFSALHTSQVTRSGVLL